MRQLSISLCGLLFCIDAFAGVRLPTVDVANGTVSARAMFGETVAPVKKVAVKDTPKNRNSEKKVVARSAQKKLNTHTNKIASNTTRVDVLRPARPSSDLWARSDAPLRMPRMDEIAVMRSDDLLPEESLDGNVVRVAERNSVKNENLVAKQEVMQELDFLRSEIARLNDLQKQNEDKIAAVRPVVVRTPISGDNDVRAVNKKDDSINVQQRVVPMEKSMARSAVAEPVMASVGEMNKMSPNELKKAFKKTYLSENKHLSTYKIDERYDVVSDMTSSAEGFTAQRDLSEMAGGVRPLEIKITFRDSDAGLSRDNYNLLSETASIVVNNPKRAIQVAIPESATYSKDSRKLAARRLAIVEQVLRDTGVADQRIVPVLSQRDDDVFVLRIISGEQFDTLSQQKRNMFGDNVSKQTYKSMSW